MNNHWDERFMDVARMIAMWSKDSSTRCAAILVNDHKAIIGAGFNGFARGMDDSPELYADRTAKLECVIHAEENSILLAPGSLRGATMYVTGMPCASCAARIIQAGIKTVVIPDALEDPFLWRGRTYKYGEKYAKSSYFFDQADVLLRVMDTTNYDARLLMGPKHPYFEGRADDHFDQFDHYCR